MQQVRDFMTREIVSIRPDTTLRDAACAMRDHLVGCLPVIENDRPLGILTDRDIVIRAVAEGRIPNEAIAVEAMTASTYTIHDDEPITAAAELMKLRAVRRLIATDHEGRPTGILSIGDLAACRGDEECSRAGETVFHSKTCAAK